MHVSDMPLIAYASIAPTTPALHARQVRIIDLNRSAAKPLVCHRARVKALATINSFCILSGSEGVLTVV